MNLKCFTGQPPTVLPANAASRMSKRKSKRRDWPGKKGDRIVSRLLQERFIDESRFARYFVNDKLRFNKWGRVKINYEMQRKGIPIQYPLGSTGRYRRTRISLHPSFSPEKQKESNPWEGRSGSLRQTAPLRRRTRFRNKGNKPLPETTVQRE